MSANGSEFDPEDFDDPSQDPDPFSQVDPDDTEDDTDTDPAPDRQTREEREETYQGAFDDDDGTDTTDDTQDDSDADDGGSDLGPGGMRGPSAEERAETIGGDEVTEAAEELDDQTDDVQVEPQDVTFQETEEGTFATVGGAAGRELASQEFQERFPEQDIGAEDVQYTEDGARLDQETQAEIQQFRAERRQEGFERMTRDRPEERAFSGLTEPEQDVRAQDETLDVVGPTEPADEERILFGGQRAEAETQFEEQLSEQVSGEAEVGEDFRVVETERGFEAELTEQGERRVAPSQERFGDIPVESPFSDRRLETDLRAADAFYQENIAQPAGTIAETGFSPDEETEVSGFAGGAVEGAVGVFSPAGIALEMKEIGEFAATQPQRIVDVGEEGSGRVATEQETEADFLDPTGSTNFGDRLFRESPASIDVSESREFGQDVGATVSDTVEGATEAFEADPGGATGRTAGGLVAAGYAGSRVARGVPGVRGSDISGRVLIGAGRAGRRAGARVRSGGRRFMASERGQLDFSTTRRTDTEVEDVGFMEEELGRFETATAIRRGEERAEERFIEESIEAGRRQERGDEPRSVSGQEDVYTAPGQENVRTADPSATPPGTGPTIPQRRAFESSFDDDVDLSPRESQLAAQLDLPDEDLRLAAARRPEVDADAASGLFAPSAAGVGTGALSFGLSGVDARSDVFGDIDTTTGTLPGVDTRIDADTRVDSDIRTETDLRFDTRQDARTDTRADTRADTRFDTRVDTRFDTRQDTRIDTRFDTRQDFRSDFDIDPDDMDEQPELFGGRGVREDIITEFVNPLTGEANGVTDGPTVPGLDE